MEPEDIIIQGNWNQLTPAQRDLIRELAADEEEFRFMKKMLTVAKSSDEVPAISPGVKTRIDKMLKPPPSIKPRKLYQWAAAAAILAVIVVALLIFIRKPATSTERDLTNAGPHPKSKPSMIVEPKQNKSTDTVLQPHLQQPAIVHVRSVKPHRKQIFRPKALNNQPAMAAVNTSVAANTEFLDLLTKVY